MSIINFNFKLNNDKKSKYITMIDMGNYCRLGNQMFQYAFLRYVSDITKLPIHIRNLNTNNVFYKTRLLECFKLQNIKILDENDFNNSSQTGNDKNNKIYNIKETTLEFDEKLINEIKSIDLNQYDIININGYFQTEKYFTSIKEEILNDFKFNDNIENIANGIIDKYKKGNILISLHIRRGDITTLKAANPPLTLSYIKNSIEYMNEKIKENILYLVLSDDIKYCKEILKGDNIIFISERTLNIQNEYIDMCVMSKCNHHILSGSSFSWWGAYLGRNQDKIVIVPDPWFNINHEDGKRLCSQDKDVIPKNWIKINLY